MIPAMQVVLLFTGAATLTGGGQFCGMTRPCSSALNEPRSVKKQFPISYASSQDK